MCGGKLREKFHQHFGVAVCILFWRQRLGVLLASVALRTRDLASRAMEGEARWTRQYVRRPQADFGRLRSLAETRTYTWSGRHAALGEVSRRRRGFYRICRSI